LENPLWRRTRTRAVLSKARATVLRESDRAARRPRTKAEATAAPARQGGSDRGARAPRRKRPRAPSMRQGGSDRARPRAKAEATAPPARQGGSDRANQIPRRLEGLARGCSGGQDGTRLCLGRFASGLTSSNACRIAHPHWSFRVAEVEACYLGSVGRLQVPNQALEGGG
jgi:hypothetical protein